jgi:hypothetical protein
MVVATVHDEVEIGDERAQWAFATTQVYVREGDWLYLAGHTAAAPEPSA